MLVSESVSRLQICPLYIFGNKATDGTYRSKYWFPGFGFDSFAKATALCSYRISFFCVYETGGPTFSTSLGQATFRGVAQAFPRLGWSFPAERRANVWLDIPCFLEQENIWNMIKYHQLSFYKNYMEKKQFVKTPNGFFQQLCRRQIFEKDWQHVCYGHPSRWTQVMKSNDHLFVKMISKMSTTNPDTSRLLWVHDHIQIPHYKWTTMAYI